MAYIERKEYLDRIIDLEGTPDIKIITGVRRSGKSELMKAYIDFLRRNRKNANIVFIDFFDLSNERLKEYHALHDYIKEKYDPDKYESDASFSQKAKTTRPVFSDIRRRKRRQKAARSVGGFADLVVCPFGFARKRYTARDLFFERRRYFFAA